MATTTKDTMTTGEPPKGATPDEIEKHIEATRADLGETVEALSNKLDVRSQAQEKLASAKTKAGRVATNIKTLAMRPVTMIAAGATVIVAGVVGAVAWKRHH